MTKLAQTTALLTVAGMLAAGCGKKPEPESVTKTQARQPGLLAGLMTETQPAEAVSIPQARATVEPGKPVTVFGTVGGVVAPFVKERASMVIADHSTLKGCSATCGSCPTPWDFCCEPPEARYAGTLTVKVVGDDGMLIKQSLEGFSGLKANSIVTIQGTYAEEATAEMVIINADKIYLQKEASP